MAREEGRAEQALPGQVVELRAKTDSDEDGVEEALVIGADRRTAGGWKMLLPRPAKAEDDARDDPEDEFGELVPGAFPKRSCHGFLIAMRVSVGAGRFGGVSGSRAINESRAYSPDCDCGPPPAGSGGQPDRPRWPSRHRCRTSVSIRSTTWPRSSPSVCTTMASAAGTNGPTVRVRSR